ncbi:RNA polymerase sigma factor [Pseudonocardia bannensis]|uniref:Sigma-70 family RNA polymerase sigma factor n=1 Tax=Pseudonocardia bannensis TaxID=630973 RepID=A0A848DPK1_9PSEU|nr:sigma-70 family RNA polymerase sigma factor [Pseudonocardia bannensis]NMH94465.1 sigma-70 family RNA polymerase sigma factor [Pseudonocardia bannensis]
MGEEFRDESAAAGHVDEAEVGLRLALVADLDAGFAEVVRAHERVVYSVALRLSIRPADAEDLAAEAFLRAYRALRDYDGTRIRELRLRPWLLTILRNTARNAARDASRRPGPPPAFEPVAEHSAGPSAEQQVERDDVQRALGMVLARLPEVQRTAVVLRHVVGLPTGEVADVLGCPDGTAKSHISRGLQRLRALLAEQDDDGPGRSSIGLRPALTAGRTVR